MQKKIHNWLSAIAGVLTQPKRFFTKIVADGNLEESMLRAFMYGLLAGLLVLGLRLLGGATVDECMASFDKLQDEALSKP